MELYFHGKKVEKSTTVVDAGIVYGETVDLVQQVAEKGAAEEKKKEGEGEGEEKEKKEEYVEEHVEEKEEEIQNQLEVLQSKIDELTTEVATLKEENARLMKELITTRQQADTYKQQLDRNGVSLNPFQSASMRHRSEDDVDEEAVKSSSPQRSHRLSTGSQLRRKSYSEGGRAYSSQEGGEEYNEDTHGPHSTVRSHRKSRSPLSRPLPHIPPSTTTSTTSTAVLTEKQRQRRAELAAVRAARRAEQAEAHSTAKKAAALESSRGRQWVMDEEEQRLATRQFDVLVLQKEESVSESVRGWCWDEGLDDRAIREMYVLI